MSFTSDLKKISDDAAAKSSRLDNRGIAASIVLGLVVARLEELHPGSRDKMMSQLENIAEHFAANEELSKPVADEVVRYARVLLNTSNT